jgi:two-component system LytT family response regulator
MMLRTIIIDDEKKNRIVLQKMLEQHCQKEIEIVALCENALLGKDAIETYKPDLIFLDVEMPKQNGFEMLQSLKSLDFSVVFVTAHDHYAIKAIKFSALDFLLKPIDAKELKLAVEKAERNSQKAKSNEQFHILFHSLNSTHKKIALPTRNGLVVVNVSEILRCEAESNYTRIFLTNQELFLASKTLKDFEQLLEECNFVRIHQSHLVNFEHIKKYNKGDGGSVILTDGTEVEVSRRQKEVLLRKLT